MLRLDNFDDLTQLLCASGEAGDFQSNDRVSRLCLFQKRRQLTLHGSVPVFVFQKDALRPGLLQFPHLAVYVLLALVGGASCVSVVHLICLPSGLLHGLCVARGAFFLSAGYGETATADGLCKVLVEVSIMFPFLFLLERWLLFGSHTL